jgi:predicted O-linked N-acetylglucosamine transferase (SPINDLY family)
MDPSVAAAEAALAARKPDVAIAILVEAASKPETATVLVLRRLTALLFRQQRFQDTVKWAKAGLEKFPKDFDMWNVLGVAERRLRRFPEALAALDKAQKLAPKSLMPVVNKINLFHDQGDGKSALPLALRLVREEPRNAEFHRLVALAYRHQGELEKSAAKLEAALKLKPDLIDAWLDRTSIATALQHHEEAVAIIDRALQAVPDHPRLLETKTILLRRAGRMSDAEAFLRGLIEQKPDAGWAHYQLGRTISDRDRKLANEHFRKAVELEPANATFAFALAESLDRSRFGDEGQNIQEAYDLICKLLALGPPRRNHVQTARQICLRVAAHEKLPAFGAFGELGREWARNGNHAAFLQHLGRVETPEDRLELVHQHRMWGDGVLAQARRNPVAYPAPRSPGKIRLGFMSSDLRAHPVAYFAMPVFEFVDRERFEVYCYSYYTGANADAHQQYIMSRSNLFRWVPSVSDRDAAQMIANDQLDILFELGGSTHMNKLEVMAYRPAPIQASWLGYPHSAGLSTIDYLLTDPFITPTRPGMLIEQPLVMPKTWISLGTNAFRETEVVNPQTPEERNGYITFGTANNPHKYGPEMLRVWARTVAAVPGSQFLFVRPEGGASSFRENLRSAFAREGVEPDRVKFAAVRGAHLPYYNEIDIALDTFPLTGGTTTCETLWMGVPVVAKVGDAFFERLSYSILNNAGLGDLVGRDEAEFVDIAMRLAADPARRKDLRANLRERLKASPLGQREVFARDFYDLMARTVEEHRQKQAVSA